MVCDTKRAASIVTVLFLMYHVIVSTLHPRKIRPPTFFSGKKYIEIFSAGPESHTARLATEHAINIYRIMQQLL